MKSKIMIDIPNRNLDDLQQNFVEIKCKGLQGTHI
jgi:hypothetical protein